MAFQGRPERPRNRVAEILVVLGAVVFVGIMCGFLVAPQWTLRTFGWFLFAFFTVGPLAWWIVGTVKERRWREQMIRDGKGHVLRRIDRWRRIDEWLDRPGQTRPPDA